MVRCSHSSGRGHQACLTLRREGEACQHIRWVSRLQSYTHRLAQLDLGGRASHYLCCVQQPRSKPCNLQAHAQPCRSHHSIGCSQHGDACLGCHGEMKRVEAAQRMPGVTRDQIGGL